MAQRRRRKRGWLKTLLLFTLTPLIVWALAFVVWFFWYDIMWMLNQSGASPAKRSQASRRVDAPRERGPQEQIKEEDRKKLEEILRERR